MEVVCFEIKVQTIQIWFILPKVAVETRQTRHEIHDLNMILTLSFMILTIHEHEYRIEIK